MSGCRLLGACLLVLSVPLCSALAEPDAQKPTVNAYQGAPPAEDTGLVAVLHPGAVAWGFDFDWEMQHNLPSHARSGIKADTLRVRRTRISSPRAEVGFEAAVSHLEVGHDIRAVSAAALYRHYFTLEPRRAAFWEGGIGVINFDELVRELATHTNFVEHVGVGWQWPSGDKRTWTAEYRFQHISNAGREHPNIGLNSSVLLLGYSWYH